MGSQWRIVFAAAVNGMLSERHRLGHFLPTLLACTIRRANVWEWVKDCYHEDYNGAPEDGSAWTTGDCSRRVVRGGSWISNPEDLRSAFRGRIAAGVRDFELGFRVGRTLLPP